MATHPLWRPFELTDLDVVVTVTVTVLPDKPIEVVPYDAGWPARNAQLGERVRRMLGDRVLDLQHQGLFRDWLRDHPDDRDAYGALKAELAGRGFTRVMDYNNHKAELVYDIHERAFAADPDHPHDPQTRP